MPYVQRAAGWKHSLGVLPAIGVGLLPKVVCPACWPAYTALLSSLGIGFLPTLPYLMPLTLVSLTVAVAALAWSARRRNALGILGAGFLGAVLVMVGRFALQSNAVLYGGIAMLCGASFWNAWPKRERTAPAELPPRGRCPACPVDE